MTWIWHEEGYPSWNPEDPYPPRPNTPWHAPLPVTPPLPKHCYRAAGELLEIAGNWGMPLPYPSEAMLRELWTDHVVLHALYAQQAAAIETMKTDRTAACCPPEPEPGFSIARHFLPPRWLIVLAQAVFVTLIVTALVLLITRLSS